ncbi:discoidin domain-containing protein [Paenibacillus silviterrae]|uniref:discoidin domain-containing protein n=1 Tax=Paenibacillus silviterrae TaxID=3242194 RepID=UPI0025426E1B|nr:discoidin domain-containing protein [Paenibacillus chinjuensis]
MLLVFSMLVPLLTSIPPIYAADASVNLALGKIAGLTKSSDCSGCNPTGPVNQAVDGNATTPWLPTNADITDNGNVWLQIDVGGTGNVGFDRIVLKGMSSGFVTGYEVYTKKHGSTTEDFVLSRTSNLNYTEETIDFAATEARYVKVVLFVSGSRKAILTEVEVYNRSGTPPSTAVLSDVYFAKTTLSLDWGQSASLPLLGVLSDGQPANLTGVVTYSTSDPTVAVVNESGQVTAANKTGNATITGTAVMNNITKSATAQVQVNPPSGTVLSSVYFANYSANQQITLDMGQSLSLQLKGTLFNGQPADVTGAMTYSSSDSTVVTVNASGIITAANKVGTATITGSATLQGVTKSVTLQVQVNSPTALSAVAFYDTIAASYPENGTLTLAPGATHQLSVKGIQVNMAEADLSNAVVTFNSGDPQSDPTGPPKGAPEVIQVTQNGLSAQISAIGTGTRYIQVIVTKGDITKTARIWVDVYPQDTDRTKVNLAQQKPVTTSSFCGNSCNAPTGTYDYYAVDGKANTYWRALSGDYNDDKQHHLIVDFGRNTEFNKAFMRLNNKDIKNYELSYSNDGQTWTSFYTNRLLLANTDTAIFEPVRARYLKVNIWALRASTPLIYELEVYRTNEAPVPPISNALASVFLKDSSVAKYEENAVIYVEKGSTGRFEVGGTMVLGQELNPSEAQISFAGSQPVEGFPVVATIGQDGSYVAHSGGVITLTATVTYGAVTKSSSVFLVVRDDAARIADTGFSHPAMKSVIGTPSFVHPGEPYPSVIVHGYTNAFLTGQVRKDGQTVVHSFEPANLTAGARTELTIPGAAAHGMYEVDLQFAVENGTTVYDKLYFTVMDVSQIPSDQSRIAYLGTDGRMVYIPDYRGNRILDFSNVGYMGGGVKLPDVQARVAVEPGEGDDTARIQSAIDTVSQLPVQPDGFRGAVLLKKGTYELDGELFIRNSGVVLRGEDEEETVLLARGPKRDYILTLGDPRLSPVLQEDTVTKITDLYVPSGSRTFHVQDSSGYRAGDKIMVRRYGNSSWIHEIHMDQILPSTDEATIQWSPFTLDFDRVITKVDGNEITVDAPIANAIELIWGGGDIRKYNDSSRIERVGVEKLRVDVVFDSSKTLKHSSGEVYYADENKPESFARFENAKNGWLRNVKAEHLEYALVHVGRNAKWITIQDSQSLEMVSIITGSRRYPFFYSGQLALTQRVHADKARHAFIVNSRVSGPNVFTNSTAGIEYAESEPHHRWSVGGLFDRLQANANIMDRANYGTGHGWAGASYVVWNHEGELGVQKPPTAQNYAIGLVGKRYAGDYGQALGQLVNADGTVVDNVYYGNGKPAGNDPARYREQGYWEKQGGHVAVPSLYTQQLQDRLGMEAVINIQAFPVGGGELDIPKLPDIPREPNPPVDPTPEGPKEPTDPTPERPEVPNDPSGGESSADTSSPLVAVPPAAPTGSPKPAVDSNGQAKLRVDLLRLEAEAQAGKPLKLEVPKTEGARAYAIGLPTAFFTGQKERSIEVLTELGTVQLSNQMLPNLPLSSGGEVELIMKPVTKDTMPQHIQFLIGDRPAVDLEMRVDGVSIMYNNPNAPVKVSLPYRPTGEEVHHTDRIVVWYLNEANKAEVLPNSRYHPTTGFVTFTTTHFSKYAVVYVPSAFEDLHEAEWARKPIEALAARGIIHGVSDRSFSPQASITRADFILLLVQTLGLTTSLEGSFEDVQPDDYYYEVVRTAKALSIIEGREHGRFAPKDRITREEMMTITARALAATERNATTPSMMNERDAADVLASFQDQAMLASYAKDAVLALLKAGYITGDGQLLHPKGHTTRAETAMLMYRLLSAMSL